MVNHTKGTQGWRKHLLCLVLCKKANASIMKDLLSGNIAGSLMKGGVTQNKTPLRDLAIFLTLSPLFLTLHLPQRLSAVFFFYETLAGSKDADPVRPPVH